MDNCSVSLLFGTDFLDMQVPLFLFVLALKTSCCEKRPESKGTTISRCFKKAFSEIPARSASNGTETS